MAKWRMKAMELEEWARLQDHLEKLQVASGGDPELAMFMRRAAGEPGPTEIYITARDHRLVEIASPGGWQDSEPPSGKGIGLLVGANDPWTRFGIEYER